MNKFLFCLSLALIFVENAGAACNIKLHVQVPNTGNDWSNFYVVFGTGTSDASPAAEDRLASGATADAATGAGWYVADLNTLNPGTPNQGFLLMRTNTAGQSKIGGGYNVTAATNFLACPTGAAGEDYYLYENPENPGTSILSRTSPSDPGGPIVVPGTGRTFYLLPPNKKEWIEGIPYIMEANGNKKPMAIDPDRCGWYKAEYDFDEPIPERMMIGIGPRMLSPINGGIFNLSEKFEEISVPSDSRNLFFVSETSVWRATDPNINERERCSYNFAAIIYDTDRSVNCSFNPNNNTAGWSATTFTKGIVQPTLDANRKLVFNGAAAIERCSRSNESGNDACVYSSASEAPQNCISGWNAANFNKAWDAADPNNVVRSYDMPFQRSSTGLWEFNSNQLCRNGNFMDLNGNCSGYGGYLGGFFPDELQTRGDADYSECPDCDAKYNATGWSQLANNVNPWCYERGWRGTGRNTGDLSSAQTTEEINAVMTGAGCTEEINGSNFSNLYSNTTNGSPGQRNFFFCFESHATFIYESGQEFFFSGDDDIWIFINNRLALDIGGVHSAVPGYIKLDTIKPALVSGEEYPIDIFFCERNLNQSNIRITTNMYFDQALPSSSSGGKPSSSSEEDLSSSSGEEVPIVAKAPPIFRTQEPAYYNLKGEPLGKQRPKRAGVYIVRQNGVNKIEVVR